MLITLVASYSFSAGLYVLCIIYMLVTAVIDLEDASSAVIDLL